MWATQSEDGTDNSANFRVTRMEAVQEFRTDGQILSDYDFPRIFQLGGVHTSENKKKKSPKPM